MLTYTFTTTISSVNMCSERNTNVLFTIPVLDQNPM